DFGFEEVGVKLSTRPPKRVGADALWDQAEADMSAVLEQIGRQSGGKIKTGINPGEGAFYGPKFEYVLRDAIGRDWQCGTTQVDFNLPGRFAAFYIDADGEKKTPVMIHRAIFGSPERCAGFLLETTAGPLPLWLAPVQVKVCTIVSEADTYAEQVLIALSKAGLRADSDLRNEKINYKVREHSLAKVPVLLVVGKREAEERTVSIRRLGSQQQQVMGLDAALALLTEEAVPPHLKRQRSEAPGAGGGGNGFGLVADTEDGQGRQLPLQALELEGADVAPLGLVAVDDLDLKTRKRIKHGAAHPRIEAGGAIDRRAGQYRVRQQRWRLLQAQRRADRSAVGFAVAK